MPIYRYTAINRHGDRKKGKHEAANEESVKEYIQSLGYHPLTVKRFIGDTQISLKQKIGTKDLALFCRQFYVMLDAGVPIIRCIRILRTQMANKRLKELLDQIYQELQKGRELSSIIGDHTKDFPDMLVQMVKVGEASGALDKIMERMAIHFEREFTLSNKIKNVMRYPLFLIGVTGAMLIVIFTFVMPTFINIYDNLNVELPAITRFMLNMSGVFSQNWYFILAAILLGILIFRRYIINGKNSLWDRFLLKVPVLNHAIKSVASARLSRTMAILFASGVSLTEILDITKRLVNNRIVERGLEHAKYETQKGTSLSRAVAQIGFFDPMIISMMTIGEETGAMDTVLHKAANFFDEESEYSIQKLVSMIEPMMIILIAVVVGFIVISVALPMFSMMGNI